MKEKSININRVYLYSLLPIIIGTPTIVIAYQLCYGTKYRETLYQNPTLLLYFILLLPILIILHELIHGVFLHYIPKVGLKESNLESFGNILLHIATVKKQ